MPFILGRPFLATSGALIDVQSGDLTFCVNGEEMPFSIYRPTQSQEERATCNRVESVEKPIVKTQFSLIPVVPTKEDLKLPMMEESKTG